jgi:predicted DNA-binding transcriptional regulator YafY
MRRADRLFQIIQILRRSSSHRSEERDPFIRSVRLR